MRTKRKITAFLVVAVMLCSAFLYACGKKPEVITPEKPTITDIQLYSLPSTTVYTPNETFDKDGLQVKALYSDETTKVVPLSDCAISAPDMATTGKKTVTVGYSGFSKSFDIYVYLKEAFVPGTAAETEYLYNHASGLNKGERFADYDGFFTYLFKLDTAKMYTAALLNVTVGGEYVVSVSMDDVHYQLLSAGPTGEGRVDSEDLTFDLSTEMNGQAPRLNLTDNHGMLYVKFTDGDTATGFGPSLGALEFFYLESTDPNPPVPDIIHAIEYKSDGVNDLTYMFFDDSQIFERTEEEGGDIRFADGRKSWAYAFDLKAAIKKATLNLKIQNQFKVEMSVDYETWKEVASQSVGSAASDIVIKIDELPKNVGKLYFRFSDKVPEDPSGCILYTFKLSYVLATESEYAKPAAVADTLTGITVFAPPAILSYPLNGTIDKSGMIIKASYFSGTVKTAANSEITLECDMSTAGTKTVTATYQGKTARFDITVTDVKPTKGNAAFVVGSEEEKVFIVADASNIGTAEDAGADGMRRYADDETYMIYKFDLSSTVSAAQFDIELQNRYKLDISFDRTTWVEIGKSAEGTALLHVTFDINSKLTGNTGILYLKITDSDTELAGFGGVWKSLRLVYTNENETNAVIAFDVVTSAEIKYIYEESGKQTTSRPAYRWTGDNSYITYKFDVSEYGVFSGGNLGVLLQHKYSIDISFDNTIWKSVANSAEESQLAYRKNNLDELFTGNGGVIYIRIGNAVTGGGMGLWFYYFNFDYTIAA